MDPGMGTTLDVQVFDARDPSRRVRRSPRALPRLASRQRPELPQQSGRHRCGSVVRTDVVFERPTTVQSAATVASTEPVPRNRPTASHHDAGAPSVGQPEAQGIRHVEVVADGEPHGLRIKPGRQGLVGGLPIQRGKYMITGHGGRSDRPELGLHQTTELGQAHGNDSTDSPSSASPVPTDQAPAGRPAGRDGCHLPFTAPRTPARAHCRNGSHRIVEPTRAAGHRRRPDHHVVVLILFLRRRR